MKVAFLDTVHPILLDRLNSNGYICEELYNISREEILKGGLEEYTGLVIRSRLTIDARLLASLPSLKWIARSGSGLDNIDVEEAEARGVRVINSPEGNRDAVGEHALGMLLSSTTIALLWPNLSIGIKIFILGAGISIYSIGMRVYRNTSLPPY